MSETFTLDPVTRIPDAPDDESKILEWAKALTESLQKDHVENVDRTETMVMSANGLGTRPGAMGARRFFFDEKTGTLYIDSENSSGVDEWQNINNPPTYVIDGIGVHVKYNASLPYSAGTSGLFSFDEEVYDKADYWIIGSPTEITPPDTKRYSIVFVATITNLATDEEMWVATDINGVTSELNPNESATIVSTGSGEEYELKISMTKDMTDADTLKFGWNSTASFTLTECYAIVSPMTLSGGGGAVPDDSGITDHGLLSGLTGDSNQDHDAIAITTNTSSFGEILSGTESDVQKALDILDDHTHTGDVYIDNAGWIYWRNQAGSDWLAQMTTDTDNSIGIGNTASGRNTKIYGYDILLTAGRNIDISAAFSGSGYLSLDGDSVDISATGATITLDPSSYTYLNSGARITENNMAIEGRITSSATYHDLIKLNSANQAQFGSSSIQTWISANTVLRLGRTGAYVYMEDSGSSWNKVLGFNGTTLEVGTIGNTTKVSGLNTTGGQCGMLCVGRSTVAGPPTTTHFPSNSWGVHRDSNASATYFVFNRGGTIEKVQLT